MTQLSRILLLVLLLVLVNGEAAATPYADGMDGQPASRYSRVFSFGDSLTDTGNAAILPATAGGPFSHAPYGETYFHHPSGRASDGRLIIDFIVESLGLPQPPPYLAGETADDFRRGANFAVGGATALDPAFLKSRGIATFVPVSLSKETSWFSNVLELLASSAYEETNIMASSVFYFGEIGVNDYIFALFSNRTAELAASLVPDIVAVTRSALTAVIDAGARTVLVTGMIPLGCEPELLALFPGDAHGESGCITGFNEVAQLHNRALNRMLRELRRTHPGTTLFYADIYRPIANLVASPSKYGFGDRPLAAFCSGGAGPYHFDMAAFCGTPDSTESSDPAEFLSWDGIHFTDAANRFIAQSLLRGLYNASAMAEPQTALL
ncbi:GDSL esterase/lipase [Hordeum vulgare]|nr:GDSL esterase/lipase [Hordeum vulgare]